MLDGRRVLLRFDAVRGPIWRPNSRKLLFFFSYTKKKGCAYRSLLCLISWRQEEEWRGRGSCTAAGHKDPISVVSRQSPSYS